MDEKDVKVMPEESIDSLSPMFFAVSCAFSVLKLLPEPGDCDERLMEIRNRMLKESVYLLGLFVWRLQTREGGCGKSDLLRKLKNAEKEIVELKKIRSEDAKANQKVVSIVAAREQSWFDERRKLRQQIGGLMNDLRVLESRKEKSICELNGRLKETVEILKLKDESIEQGELKRREIEEALKKVEDTVDELREMGRRETQRHSSEITKHKTAFIELVSNQRQLEAEMDRALRQVEVVKHEIDSVLEQKDECMLMNQRLSMELVKMRNELEQTDQILSAMLRKSKLDTAEKQMLLKEMKSSKVKRKQAEFERTKWKVVSDSKNKKGSLRNMLSRHVQGTRTMMMLSDAEELRSAKTTDYHLDFEQPDPHLTDRTEESYDVGRLENSENKEEKYKFTMEQRHSLEIDAFVEQLRLKDEKLDAFRWRLMSMEIESNRMHSHMEGLNREITQLRQDNLKLKAQLLDKEAELHSLKEQLVLQFNPPNLQKLNFQEAAVARDTVWSKVKVIKRKPGQRRQEMKAIPENTTPAYEQLKNIVLTLKPPIHEMKEGNAIVSRADHSRQDSIESDDAWKAETSTSFVHNIKSTWKMDIHALGVYHKIKRLKQNLIILEKLKGKQESSGTSEKNASIGEKGSYALITLLNKQVDRYQSLQGKTDNLCERMHVGNLNLNSADNGIPRTGAETKKLEQFLEETFQLQRYIVATGQKLMEVQPKIALGFISDAENIVNPESSNMKRFADSIGTLFRDIQRGLEVRISRIIGDLGGTLACDGMIHLNR